MIKEAYCSFEASILLKKKGFEGDINAYYHIWDSGDKVCSVQEFRSSEAPHLYIPAPTLQTAMKWLREVHKIYITIPHRFSHNADQDVCFSYYINVDKAEDGEYMTYEEAVEAALKYCLKSLI